MFIRITDRMVVGAAYPVSTSLQLGTYDQLKAVVYFLSRREIGIINIAGTGTITVDGEKFELQKKDCLYIGMGKQIFPLQAMMQPMPLNSFSSLALHINLIQHV
ncbi:MAG: hypothetical protein WDM90_04495 [Ferruginibacter sp.]